MTRRAPTTVTATKLCPQCGATYAPDQRFCATDGAALRSQDPSAGLVGEVVADRYLVQRRLGEGGMGEVYLAEHVRMGRLCALKVMRRAMADDPDSVSRFNREAANASRINHPNVAAIHDFGETSDGLIYLAMEYVEGEPLRATLERAGALPPARVARLVGQVAAALDAAHALGIVHRDLKPDNVMLGRDRDERDVVKVVDFGIAKTSGAAAQQVTRTGLIVGTPEYMSPEQLAGDPVDHRSDVYALGLVAYAMLTGLHPYPSETIADTLVQRLTTPPRRLAELHPGTAWSPEVQAVLDRALARRPADRFERAGGLAVALTAALDASGLVGSDEVALSEARTQVLQAVVGPAATARGVTAPAAVPATVVGDVRAAGLRGNETVRRGRRVTALLAGVGVLGVAIAGAMYVAAPNAGAADRGATVTSGDAPAATPLESPLTDQLARPATTEPHATETAARGLSRPAESGAAGSGGPTTSMASPSPAPAIPSPVPPSARDASLHAASSLAHAPAPEESLALVEGLERLLTDDAALPSASESRSALRSLEPLPRDLPGDSPLELRVRFLHAVFTGLAGEQERGCDELLALPARRMTAALPPALTGFANLLRTNCEQPAGVP